MFFASDNAGPVHPEVLAALARANEGYAMPYGADDGMGRVRQQIRDTEDQHRAQRRGEDDHGRAQRRAEQETAEHHGDGDRYRKAQK